jgi:PAS domain S-box-containing protein
VEQLGLEVVGVAETAEEALVAAGLCHPDVALMDVRIAGKLDGIDAAQMLRGEHQVPSIFLTSYSDETTIARAARAMPYGYLTKPFQSGELKATLRVALHKAKVDAADRAAYQEMAATVDGMREGVLLLSLEEKIQFMNAAAEELTGWSLDRAAGHGWREVLNLSDHRDRSLPGLQGLQKGAGMEEFGWTLNGAGGQLRPVDLSLTALLNGAGERAGFVVTVRNAAERMRNQAIDETAERGQCFDHAPMAMVQLDEQGRIARVNQALLREAGMSAESIVGRSLTGLSMDPDPSISRVLLRTLLESGAIVSTAKPVLAN